MPTEPFDEESDESSFYGPFDAGYYDPATGRYTTEGDDVAAVDEDFADALADEMGQDAAVIAIPDEAEDTAPYPTPPSLSEVLTSSTPILLVSRPHNKYDVIPPLLRVISRAHGSALVLGASTSLLNIKPKDGNSYLQAGAAAAVRIADPVAFVSHDEVPGRVSVSPTRLRWPYQEQGTLTSDDDEAWIPEVVAAQRSAGANLLLSPGRYLPGDKLHDELDMAVRQFQITASLTREGEANAMNLTLATHWLTHESKRDELIQRLVEAAPSVVYARVLWPLLGTAAQPVDGALLAGYRELCEVAASENIRLLLPNTDTTGWLAQAWGAAGFGTGISAEARAFTPTRPSGGGATPAKERFMEDALLHTVLRDEHQRMVAADIVGDCVCSYCRMAASGRPWSPDVQGCHHVWTVAALTAALPADGRAVYVTERVKAAQEVHTRTAEYVALDKGSIPRHLPVWNAALS